MPHQLYDIRQAAGYLHVTEEDVRRMVKRGELPCLRKGDRMMFQRREIDPWASQPILAFDKKTLTSFHAASGEVVEEGSQRETLVSDFFRREWIEPALPSKTRAAVFRDMDTDNSGALNTREFGLAMKELGVVLSRKELKEDVEVDTVVNQKCAVH